MLNLVNPLSLSPFLFPFPLLTEASRHRVSSGGHDEGRHRDLSRRGRVSRGRCELKVHDRLEQCHIVESSVVANDFLIGSVPELPLGGT